jgi:hypothetical protein
LCNEHNIILSIIAEIENNLVSRDAGPHRVLKRKIEPRRVCSHTPSLL